MPLISETFVNPFLKAEDITTEDGSPVAFTVESVEIGNVGEKQQPIVKFKELPKKILGLNKTNASAIAEVLGDNTDNWIGYKISLVATECMWENKNVPCIRVNKKVTANLKIKKDFTTVDERPDKEEKIGDKVSKGKIPF